MTPTTVGFLVLGVVTLAYVARFIIDVGDALKLQSLRDEAEE